MSSIKLFFPFSRNFIEITFDLPCCVDFCCMAKWCCYMCIFFFLFFSIMLITRYWIQFPVVYSWTLLFIHIIYNSLHLLILNSQYFPPLALLLSNHKSILCMCESVSVFFVSCLASTYKWHYMVFVMLYGIGFSLCLSLSDLFHLVW